MIQLSWRMMLFQRDSDLVRWYQERVEHAKRSRKTLIVAFARKLIIALWRYVNAGQVPAGFKLYAAA
jgi:transposase